MIATGLEPQAQRRKPAPQLSQRERQVLKHLATGKSNKEIGLALGVTEETVKVHIRNISHETGVVGRVSLVVWAILTETVLARLDGGQPVIVGVRS
jgi:DNA-binding CsgD family transcriptional regulator